MQLVIRPATEGDARWMASHLRPEDEREIRTVSGKSPLQTLPLAVSLSSESYTFRYTEYSHPFIIFGVTDDPHNVGYGVVWLLATPEVSKGIRELITLAPSYLDRWLHRYPNGLHNYVDSRNLLHLRWLELVGFQFGESVNISGVPFFYFIRHKE